MLYTWIIHYNEITKSRIPHGFRGLDNSNPKARELFEVEPILEHIRAAEIDETAFYGFLSPNVFLKSKLTAQEILGVEHGKYEQFDIISISPGLVNNRAFLNPVVQAEIGHGDFARRFLLATKTLEGRYRTTEFASQKVKKRHFLYCHYFWAKGSFWKEWAACINAILDAARNNNDLRQEIMARCYYKGQYDYQYITFILERVASLIAHSRNLKVHQYRFATRLFRETADLLSRKNPLPPRDEA